MQNKKNLGRIVLGASVSLLVGACSPIKTSSKDEKLQLELTLHEVQINLDDLRHDLNCFKTDFQIIEGKIGNQENQIEGVKQKQVAQTLTMVDTLSEKIKVLEAKISQADKSQQAEISDIEKLSFHAKETSSSLSQYKEKLGELETKVIAQSKRFDEVKKLKDTLEAIATSLKINNEGFSSYKVKAGDSLEKIAKINKVTVDQLKKVNNLDQDLIVIGQDLKIPK
jgi:LysM repeat protein